MKRKTEADEFNRVYREKKEELVVEWNETKTKEKKNDVCMCSCFEHAGIEERSFYRTIVMTLMKKR